FCTHAAFLLPPDARLEAAVFEADVLAALFAVFLAAVFPADLFADFAADFSAAFPTDPPPDLEAAFFDADFFALELLAVELLAVELLADFPAVDDLPAFPDDVAVLSSSSSEPPSFDSESLLSASAVSA